MVLDLWDPIPESETQKTETLFLAVKIQNLRFIKISHLEPTVEVPLLEQVPLFTPSSHHSGRSKIYFTVNQEDKDNLVTLDSWPFSVATSVASYGIFVMFLDAFDLFI